MTTTTRRAVCTTVLTDTHRHPRCGHGVQRTHVVYVRRCTHGRTS